MRRNYFLLAFVMVTACFVADLYAVSDIKYTPHNMSYLNPGASAGESTNEDEICIFCHTPHGGSADGPLWNHNMGSLVSKTYKAYNSVALKATGFGASRVINVESLLCLSCHDGSIAVGDVINKSNRNPAGPDSAALFPITFPPVSQGAKIGDSINAAGTDLNYVTNDLSDDHPVSFSYTAVRNYYVGLSRGAELETFGNITAAGLRLFPQGAPESNSNQRVECSTCHDPHVDYGDVNSGSPNSANPAYTNLTPFLRMANTGSAMCLKCHKK